MKKLDDLILDILVDLTESVISVAKIFFATIIAVFLLPVSLIYELVKAIKDRLKREGGR